MSDAVAGDRKRAELAAKVARLERELAAARRELMLHRPSRIGPGTVKMSGARVVYQGGVKG